MLLVCNGPTCRHNLLIYEVAILYSVIEKTKHPKLHNMAVHFPNKCFHCSNRNSILFYYYKVCASFVLMDSMSSLLDLINIFNITLMVMPKTLKWF